MKKSVSEEVFALEKEFQDKVASRHLANAAKKLISWLCEIANGSGMDFSAEIMAGSEDMSSGRSSCRPGFAKYR